MKCPNYKEKSNAKSYYKYGTKIEKNTSYRSSQHQGAKPKRPIYKIWWFWIPIVLVLITIIVSVIGSNQKDNNSSNNSSSSKVSSNTPSISNNNNNTHINSGTLGKYEVAIKNASLTKDYEGNPAMIVTFSFKNNSDRAQSYAISIYDIAYQDDVQLDMGIAAQDNSTYEDAFKSILPGITLDVKRIYRLSNTSSPIQVEASEFASLSNEKITRTFEMASLPNSN